MVTRQALDGAAFGVANDFPDPENRQAARRMRAARHSAFRSGAHSLWRR